MATNCLPTAHWQPWTCIRPGITGASNRAYNFCMNFFEILRQHAHEQPEQVATASPRHRLTTYRKLWSRIERCSARLQGEWLVGPGDTVAYSGYAHADALVLWISLARLGARLLPLEGPARQAAAAGIVQPHRVHLLLHQDDQPPPLGQELACHPLSDIVSRHCPHEASGPEQECQPSLLLLASVPDQPAQEYSLRELMDLEPPAWPDRGPLFEHQRLAGQILPALLAARALQLE